MSTSTDASCHSTTCSPPKIMMIGAFGMTATAKKNFCTLALYSQAIGRNYARR